MSFQLPAGEDGYARSADQGIVNRFSSSVVTSNVNLRLGICYFNGADLVPDFWRPYAGVTFILGPRSAWRPCAA